MYKKNTKNQKKIAHSTCDWNATSNIFDKFCRKGEACIGKPTTQVRCCEKYILLGPNKDVWDASKTVTLSFEWQILHKFGSGNTPHMKIIVFFVHDK